MTTREPSPKQWQNYQSALNHAERHNEAVTAHISFMEKAELAVCGAALVACLNGITSAAGYSTIYTALIDASTAFFIAGCLRILAMEFRSSQYRYLRDMAFSNAQLQLHLDRDRHRKEQDELAALHKKYTGRAVKAGMFARVATVSAISLTIYELRSAF